MSTPACARALCRRYRNTWCSGLNGGWPTRDGTAQAFHVSVRTLMRRVKAETGKTPLALLQEARVAAAKRLLKESRWPIARIVEAVGYTDVVSFACLFAKQVGETPANYRRRYPPVP